MELETGAETSADDLSLHDELSQAFGAETPTEPKTATASAAQPGAASGEPNATEVALEAPKHWNEADKALFAKAPREVQQRWIGRETEQQKGLDAKFQEIAGFRREREQLDELMSPLARDLELQGVSRMQFIQSLVGAHKYFLEKPREAALWVLNQYGVDPKSLLEEPSADPRLAQVDQRFQKLETTFNGLVEQQQAAAHAERLSRVQNFAAAKDDKGQPLHPFFDEASGEILALMKASPGMDLETAYAKAVRMNDGVWEKMQAQKTLAATQAAEAERKAKIDKAKRASVGGKTPGTNGTAKPNSLRDELEAGFADWQP
jgi:hypothetical protein